MSRVSVIIWGFYQLLLIFNDEFIRRWATRLLLSSVWTLRCSCCPREPCGSLMGQWGSVKRVTWPFLRVCPIFHKRIKDSTRCVAHTGEIWFSPQSRWYSLWPCDGGPCSEPRRLFLLQHRESVPLHRHWWIRSKIQPDQVWVWLPGRLPLIALQI